MEISEAEIYELIGRQAVRLHMQAKTVAALQSALAEARAQAAPASESAAPEDASE